MSRAQELLDAATPLPWRASGPWWSTARKDGDPPSWAVDTPHQGVVKHAYKEADTALIVYAVNALPAYERIAEALDRLITTMELSGEDLGIPTDQWDETLKEAHQALAEVRGVALNV